MKTASGTIAVIGGALTGFLPHAAQAQEALTLDEIVFSAGFEAVAGERTGATVELLTADDLAATGEARVSEHLDRLPGVEVLSRGPVGTQTGLTIRGLGQNYIGVRVDGIDVADPSAPQVAFDFGRLTTGGIGRIEVLKGSQSAQYGSEAVAGVVDIRTRRATQDGLHFHGSVEYGSFDSFTGSAGATYRGASHDLAVTYTRVDTDGFSAADENLGNREDDGFESDRVNATGSVTLPVGVTLGFSALYEDAEGEFDEFAGPGGDGTPGDELSLAESYGGLIYAEFATGPFDHRIEAQHFSIERESIFNGFPFAFDGERDSFAWRSGVDLGAATRLVLGADTTEERSKQTGGFSASNDLTGVFGEITHALTPAADISLTVRHDEHSRFGGDTNGRLSGVWRAPHELTFRASAATGFRAPSNFELFSTSPFSLGDPTLKPEESLSLEAGVEKTWGARARLGVTVFHLEVEDLINFTFDPMTFLGGFVQAPGTVERTGVEVAGALRLHERLLVSGSYTYTEDDAPASVLAPNAANSFTVLTAKHSFALQAEAGLTDRLSAVITLSHKADRPVLDDYTLVGATLSFDVTDEVEAYLRLENVFDEEFQRVQGFGTADRAVFVGLRAAI